MGRNDDALYAAHAFTNVANQLAKLQGNGVADRVRDVQSGCASLDYGFQYLKKKLRLSAGRIFRREFNVIAERPRKADGLSGLLEALLTRNSQLVLQVNVGGCKKHMYHWSFSITDCVPCYVNIADTRSRKSSNRSRAMCCIRWRPGFAASCCKLTIAWTAMTSR